jgi:hypothetical protein
MQHLTRTFLTAFALVLFCSARTNAEIRGYIDGIYDINGLTVAAGWACDAGRPESIAIHMYAGGPAGTGNWVNAVAANLPSEPAVAAACGSTGSNYRFQIELSNQAENITKTIWIHGISITGGDNLTIGNSGTFTFPDSVFGYIFESPFQMRVSKKYGGAIDSFFWRGQHFVDVYDHGREWQVAAQFKGLNGCYNPTEGGSLADGVEDVDSSSRFFYLSTYNNILITKTNPAFWLRPKVEGDPANYYSSGTCTDTFLGPTRDDRGLAPGEAQNTTIRSDYEFRKMVVFGFQGIPNAIWFNTQFLMSEPVYSGIQIEAMSVWLKAEFSTYWQFTLPTSSGTHGSYSVLEPATANHHQPMVFQDPNTGLAIGTYALDIINSQDGPDSNGRENRWDYWPHDPTFNYVTFIYRIYPPQGAMQGQLLIYNSYMVVGNLDEVKAGLESLHCYFTQICP